MLTLFLRQKSGSENHVSSTTISGLSALSLKLTAAIDDVITTLLTDEAFTQDLRTLSVPLTAGSTSSAYKNTRALFIKFKISEVTS